MDRDEVEGPVDCVCIYVVQVLNEMKTGKRP